MPIYKGELKEVINIDTDKIVLVPTSDMLIKENNMLVDLHLSNVRGITESNYQKVIEYFDMQPSSDDETLIYFTKRYKEKMQDGDVELSAKGIKSMFESMNREYILSDVFAVCMKDVNYWYETEIDELIVETNAPIDLTEDLAGKLIDMQDYLDDISDRYCYMDEYKIDEKMMILYTK